MIKLVYESWTYVTVTVWIFEKLCPGLLGDKNKNQGTCDNPSVTFSTGFVLHTMQSSKAIPRAQHMNDTKAVRVGQYSIVRDEYEYEDTHISMALCLQYSLLLFEICKQREIRRHCRCFSRPVPYMRILRMFRFSPSHHPSWVMNNRVIAAAQRTAP